MPVQVRYTATNATTVEGRFACRHCGHTCGAVARSKVSVTQGVASDAQTLAAKHAQTFAEETIATMPCPACGKRDLGKVVSSSIVFLLMIAGAVGVSGYAAVFFPPLTAIWAIVMLGGLLVAFGLAGVVRHSLNEYKENLQLMGPDGVLVPHPQARS
jgi:hypothetical protein